MYYMYIQSLYMYYCTCNIVIKRYKNYFVYICTLCKLTNVLQFVKTF